MCDRFFVCMCLCQMVLPLTVFALGLLSHRMVWILSFSGCDWVLSPPVTHCLHDALACSLFFFPWFGSHVSLPVRRCLCIVCLIFVLVVCASLFYTSCDRALVVLFALILFLLTRHGIFCSLALCSLACCCSCLHPCFTSSFQGLDVGFTSLFVRKG